MKTLQFFLFGAIILLFTSWLPRSWADGPSSPTALCVWGKSSFFREGKGWQPLEKGGAFQAQDWIGTGGKGCLIVTLNGSDSITMSNDTMVQLGAPQETPGSPSSYDELFLQYGNLWITIPASEGGDRSFTITIPEGKIFTHGAVFEVIKGKDKMELEEFRVWKGSIVLTRKKRAVILNEKESVALMPGQELPLRASKTSQGGFSPWTRWNEKKDELLRLGRLDELAALAPPQVARTSYNPALIKTGSGGSAPPSGSSGSSASKPGDTSSPQQNTGTELNELRQRIRLPPQNFPSL
ncbi:MAG: hypothetical protein RDV48_02700 [Candidatus Eremiobacteraeota bacterium]|nr:hypothetical protein [Candidatus Eremiobacteraeota bacterium]